MAERSTVEFNFEFEELQTDLSKCHCCGDVIYGKMFRIACYVEDKEQRRGVALTLDDEELSFCESCQQLLW